MSISISKKIISWYFKHKRTLPWREYKNLNDNKGFSINEELLLKGKKQPVKNWKFTYKLNSINTNKE